jgi:hypothetical protein
VVGVVGRSSRTGILWYLEVGDRSRVVVGRIKVRIRGRMNGIPLAKGMVYRDGLFSIRCPSEREKKYFSLHVTILFVKSGRSWEGRDEVCHLRDGNRFGR